MTALRILVGILSSAVAIATAGSVWRWCSGRMRGDDVLWSIISVFAALHAGFFVRWLLGYAPSPDSHESAATLTGLQVLIGLIAARTLWLRFEREGWRW